MNPLGGYVVSRRNGKPLLLLLLLLLLHCVAVRCITLQRCNAACSSHHLQNHRVTFTIPVNQRLHHTTPRYHPSSRIGDLFRAPLYIKTISAGVWRRLQGRRTAVPIRLISLTVSVSTLSQ